MTDEQHNMKPGEPQAAGAGDVPTPLAPPTVPGALGRPPRQVIWPNVLGVIGVIYAVGGIFMSGWQAISTIFFDLFSGVPAAAGPNPMAAMEQWSGSMVALALVNIVLSLLLLAACVGLLMRRPWGYALLMGWAVTKLIAVVFNTIVGVAMARVMMEQAAAQGPGVPPFFTDIFIWLSMALNMLLYSAFPVFVLIWLNLGRAKREVKKWRSESPVKLASPPPA